MRLVARDKDGNEVKVGDTVTSFRGEKATLTHLTRANEFVKGGRRSGKVAVRWNPDDLFTREYYDNVFGLTVYEEE